VEQGALQYLIKPIRDEVLKQAVGRAVHLGRIARLKRDALAHLGFDDRQLGDRAGLEIALGRALGSLWMAYQPIVVARSGQLFGYEALVRSSERTLGVPTALFDAASRLGRVRQLGRAIRDEVARSLPAMATDVFVNLHGQELADDSLYHSSSLLSARARQIVLEITERESLEGLPDLRARIATLRRMGFRIAVDDLGAGYAGLTSFAALEPDIVKLDAALTCGVEKEQFKRNVIGTMVGLCKREGILVVAEGIETEGDRDVVVDLGCDLLQGFLLGRPARLEEGLKGA
jgi:EAL domain-containing protein (putative c-di-GMP-specific phosphodiesterase class I)